MSDEEAEMVEWLIEGPKADGWKIHPDGTREQYRPKQLPKLVAAGEMLRRVIAERDESENG